MKTALTLSLILLVEPAASGSKMLLTLLAFGLCAIVCAAAVVRKLRRRRPCDLHKGDSATNKAAQSVRSVLEIARETGLSQDAVRQMTRRPPPSGRTGVSGKACRISRRSTEKAAVSIPRIRSVKRYNATA